MSDSIFLLKKLCFSSKPARQKVGKYCILPPPPRIFCEICGQLLRYCEKINPQRIKDTPPVNFFLCLVLASPIPQKDYPKEQTAQLFYKQLSHKIRKKIFRFIYQNVLFGLG